ALKEELQLPFCVELMVREEALLERLSHRWVNPKTGKVYHALWNPPSEKGICDEDGSKLIQRPDDRPEVIKNRVLTYNSEKGSIQGTLKKAGASIVQISG